MTSLFVSRSSVFNRLKIAGSRYLSSRSAATPFPNVSIHEEGQFGTLDWKMYFRKEGSELVSPWHGLSLVGSPAHQSNEVTFICEMPKQTDQKMEIATDLKHNPIKQDIKKGKLRTITYGLSKFNYGALPQTWEDPTAESGHTGLYGDDDPLDVVEIGERVLDRGSVRTVRVLCSLALIDEGETDWKIIGIDLDDPLADKLHTLEDVMTHKPDAIDTIRSWYKLYKTADGKPENEYAFDGKAVSQQETLSVIQECHQAWEQKRNELKKNPALEKDEKLVWF